MPLDIKIVEYYNITVGAHAREGSKLLSQFASAGVSLLAFKAAPLTDTRTLFTLFPNDSTKMAAGAKKAGLELDGPHPALLIKGDNDEPGACGDIFEKLSQAGINPCESNGIADINSSYGILFYLEPEDCEKALKALAV